MEQLNTCLTLQITYHLSNQGEELKLYKHEPTLSWKSNSTGWWVEDTSGWYPTIQWAKINNDWYYFNASGYMVTSQYVDGYLIGYDGDCK